MAGPNEASQYWEIVPAVIGGVLGALAGGIPAWLIAKRQSDESLKRDRERRTETERALAFRVGVKLLTITNSTINLYNHIKGCAERLGAPENQGMQLWQALTPMIGFTDEGEVRFDAEEMAVFAAAGDKEFMMDAMLLAQRHSSSLASFQSYCGRREAFLAVAPKPEHFAGDVGSTTVSYDQMILMMPQMIPLNAIVTGLNSGTRYDIELARKVTDRFGIVTKRYFNDRAFIAFTFPSDQELENLRKTD